MSAPYTVNIDQNAARHYADKGATILLLNVPLHTHVAFDHQVRWRASSARSFLREADSDIDHLQSYVAGAKFKGVKMLPPGMHMVSYNATSRTGDFSPTTSFFVHLAVGEVYIRRWNVEEELLLDMPADEVHAWQTSLLVWHNLSCHAVLLFQTAPRKIVYQHRLPSQAATICCLQAVPCMVCGRRHVVCMHAVLQAEPFAAGVRRFDFDQGLAPYNLHAYQQWQNLSSYISKQTISKLSPLPSGNISITAEADPAHLRHVTAAEKQLYTQLHEGRSDSNVSGEVLVIDISTPCSM